MEPASQDLSFVEPPVAIVGSAVNQVRADGVYPNRLPESCWPQLDMMTHYAQSSPSGVRLAFRTTSDFVQLVLKPTTLELPGFADQPPAPALDLLLDGELYATREARGGRRILIDLNDRTNFKILDGPEVRVRFDGLGAADKSLELWLPQSGACALVRLEVARNARVSAPRDARPRWLHYGSSISQCGEARSPARTWPAIAARRAGLHLISLGLSGSCHLDPYVSRYMRGLAADVISLKLGINVVNAASFRERSFVPAVHGFLDTLREAQPDTPILVVSPIFCPSAEDRPGPTALGDDGRFYAAGHPDEIAQGALTLQRIREILAGAVELRRRAGDERIHHLDGLELFGKDDAADLPDALHPNAAGYERMGERFHARVFAPGGVLAPNLRSR